MNSHLDESIYLNHWIHRIHEFIYLIFHLFSNKKLKNQHGIQTIQFSQLALPTTTSLADDIVFLQYLTYMYYMILLSKKTTSQKCLSRIQNGAI